MFALALLAYHNFSTDDLTSINVWLVSLKRFNLWQRIRQYQQLQGEVDASDMPSIEKLWHPLLVGVPWHDAKYTALLHCDRLDILLYQHQTRAFQYNINQWNQAIHNEHPTNLLTLSILNQDKHELPVKKNDNHTSQRVAITTPRQWKVEKNEEITVPEAKELFRVPERVDEIAWLMQSDDISLDEQVLSDQTNIET